jgi:hypothetical protein
MNKAQMITITVGRANPSNIRPRRGTDKLRPQNATVPTRASSSRKLITRLIDFSALT